MHEVIFSFGRKRDCVHYKKEGRISNQEVILKLDRGIIV